MENLNRRILIVDDDRDIRELLHRILDAAGYSPIMARNGVAALEMIRVGLPDLVISDIKMPEMDGLELLGTVKKEHSGIPMILVTAWGGVEDAVEAVKAGAYDFLTKPIDPRKLRSTVRKALEASPPRDLSLSAAKRAKRNPVIQELANIMGPSSAIGLVVEDVALVAQSDFSVVIVGETGTGKELVARAIHRAGSRNKARLVAVDCGAIPEPLFESELFGHEKGAFTGATGLKRGKLELAQGGTVFLDEIANLPMSSQIKLLRAIQEKSFVRVGATDPVKVDLRFIAATNVNLVSAGKQRQFSMDLFYRLNEFVIRVPPLRERSEDILLLAHGFVEDANESLGKVVRGFSPSAEELLTSYYWPGNVRQLKSVVRRAVLRARDMIEQEHLGLEELNEVLDFEESEASRPIWTEGMSLKEAVALNVREVERRAIIDALKLSGGNKAEAARLLKIDYTTLHSKIKLYRIES